MIIDIFVFPLFFCRYVEYYINMSGYSLCRHKCRQTLCRPQHYHAHKHNAICNRNLWISNIFKSFVFQGSLVQSFFFFYLNLMRLGHEKRNPVLRADGPSKWGQLVRTKKKYFFLSGGKNDSPTNIKISPKNNIL